MNTIAAILHPVSSYQNTDRTPQKKLEEAVSIAQSISLRVTHKEIHNIVSPSPATFFRKGLLDNLLKIIIDKEIKLLIINTTISPIQQRNIEKELNIKVLDRTGLIIEIFGARAKTWEGKLQVKLANLTYQKSRLVRSWTHLERQRGGVGFTGGPGETQIESDRRMIKTQIEKVKNKLETVIKRRRLQRKTRQSAPWPVISLVGYTNTGKSTLFNYLTKSDVMAKNMLFATLDPTMRSIKLKNKQKVILSDTVGFISELPTLLISAFRATLEEIHEADIIIHIVDISHPNQKEQKNDVLNILDSMGVDPNIPIIEVYNKVDLLHLEVPTPLIKQKNNLYISAQTGQGVEALLNNISKIFEKQTHTMTIYIKSVKKQGEIIAFLHNHGTIEKQSINQSGEYKLTIRLSNIMKGRFNKQFQQYITLI